MQDYLIIKLDRLTRGQIAEIKEILSKSHWEVDPFMQSGLRIQEELADSWEDVSIWEAKQGL